MPWLGKVRAVLEMWFPGDVGGTATANLLLGRASPAGRLPVTWPASLSQGVANDPAFPDRTTPGVTPTGFVCQMWMVGWPWGSDCTATYSEGIFMGYRWFDAQGLTPLFPFGYGLSYTTFAYSDLSVSQQPDGSLAVSFKVTNTGGTSADEVPQVYLGPPTNAPSGVQFAVESARRLRSDHDSRRRITSRDPHRAAAGTLVLVDCESEMAGRNGTASRFSSARPPATAGFTGL